MRTIGLIGGMSWESSAEYYRLANQLVAARLGGFHSARILLDSIDFADVEAMQASGDWASAAQLLARSARGLELAGAEVLVLCTNTMHIVADAIEAAVAVPFLHLADVTAAAVRRADVTRVGLLGTAFTMEQAFYRDRLTGHGLDVRVRTPRVERWCTGSSTTNSSTASSRLGPATPIAASSTTSSAPAPRA